MARLYSFLCTSVDGYFQDASGQVDWFNVTPDVMDFSVSQLNDTAMLLFGRRTYEHMAAYWPTHAAADASPTVASLMNSLPKVVFSHTLDSADWGGTRLVRGDAVSEVSELKAESDMTIGTFSATLTTNLLRAGLVDELRLMVMPTALGAGDSLFAGDDQRIPLELTRTVSYASGNVLLCYRPSNT